MGGSKGTATRELSAAPKLSSILFTLLALAALAFALRPYLDAPVAPRHSVQTSALGRCGAPAEGEHLVVTFRRKGDVVIFDGCFFAGSRGTYGRRDQ
jgi:hypothetical protein